MVREKSRLSKSLKKRAPNGEKSDRVKDQGIKGAEKIAIGQYCNRGKEGAIK